jgi:hypothetical protein
VLLCLCSRSKRPQIASSAGLWIDLARVKPILTGLEFSDHSFCLLDRLLAGILRDEFEGSTAKQDQRSRANAPALERPLTVRPRLLPEVTPLATNETAAMPPNGTAGLTRPLGNFPTTSSTLPVKGVGAFTWDCSQRILRRWRTSCSISRVVLLASRKRSGTRPCARATAMRKEVPSQALPTSRMTGIQSLIAKLAQSASSVPMERELPCAAGGRTQSATSADDARHENADPRAKTKAKLGPGECPYATDSAVGPRLDILLEPICHGHALTRYVVENLRRLLADQCEPTLTTG